jgi:hypothetical protein
MSVDPKHLTNEQLVRLIINCSRALANDYGRPTSEIARQAMAELERRSAASAIAPVLRQVGYHVGASGLRWLDRKALIDLVLYHDVPVMAHWSGDWGAPGTRQRHVMLYKTLRHYAKKFGCEPGMEHSRTNWLHDADYVHKSYLKNLMPNNLET